MRRNGPLRTADAERRQGNCTKRKLGELKQKNLHRKGAKTLRTPRQVKRINIHGVVLDFLCENFASFAPLR